MVYSIKCNRRGDNIIDNAHNIGLFKMYHELTLANSIDTTH